MEIVNYGIYSGPIVPAYASRLLRYCLTQISHKYVPPVPHEAAVAVVLVSSTEPVTPASLPPER